MSTVPEIPQSGPSSTLLPGTFSQESDFIFKDGVFYATYDGHIHPRKEASELYTVLTYVPPPPVFNENGKRTRTTDTEGHTNYPAHFYAAQLVHYGLKPLKTKAAAKKKLLSAFGGPNGKALLVPKPILDFEKSMRNRGQSKTTLKKDPVDLTSTSNPAPRTKKTARKNPKQPVPTSPSMMDVDQKPQLPADERKTEKHASAPIIINTAQAPTSTHASRTKQTARKSSGRRPPNRYAGFWTTHADSEPRGESDSPRISARAAVKKLLKPADMPKMTGAQLRDEIKRLPVGRARQILDVLLERVPAVASILEKEIRSTRASSKAKERVKPVNPSEWIGLYDIEASAIEETCGDGRHSFEIYPSSTSAHLWARFDFGFNLSGIMRSLHPVPNFLNTEIFFQWRGIFGEEGEMTFGNSDRAVITFLPGGLLEGKMCVSYYGTFKLYGSRAEPEPTELIASSAKYQQNEVKSWKKMWRGFNDHNYEVARRARWGKWGGAQSDEEAFASDTTAGKKRSPKVDLQNFMSEPSSNNGGDDDENDDEDNYEW